MNNYQREIHKNEEISSGKNVAFSKRVKNVAGIMKYGSAWHSNGKGLANNTHQMNDSASRSPRPSNNTESPRQSMNVGDATTTETQQATREATSGVFQRISRMCSNGEQKKVNFNDRQNSEEYFPVQRQRFYLAVHWPSVVYTLIVVVTGAISWYYFHVHRRKIKNSNLEFWKIHSYECTCTTTEDCDD